MKYTCNECNGDGCTLDEIICPNCCGTGKVDWIDNVFGKEIIKDYKGLTLNLNEKIIKDFVIKKIKNFIAGSKSKKVTSLVNFYIDNLMRDLKKAGYIIDHHNVSENLKIKLLFSTWSDKGVLDTIIDFDVS